MCTQMQLEWKKFPPADKFANQKRQQTLPRKKKSDQTVKIHKTATFPYLLILKSVIQQTALGHLMDIALDMGGASVNKPVGKNPFP